MAQTYTRQSSFSDGDTITAALFNNEYDQLVNAFAYSSSSASSTGHRHDGTNGQGGNIHTIGDLDFLNKIVVDSTNNRWGFFVEVSSAAVEQIRLSDGVLAPVTDSDVDLGTSSLYFKNAYIDTITTTGTITSSSTLQGTTITATTAFVPDASDGAALGTSSLEFSDLFLADGAVINFGDDQDVSLTHVADTGLLLSSTDQLQFGDSGTYIHQSADGVLDLVSDTEIEINATTIDINGAADVSGNLAVGGNLTVTGNATISGNLTFGDAASDTVAFSADVASNLLPSADNTYDIGASGSEWKDLYLDGTANIDSLVADTADINGGTIDGATIGASSATTIVGTTITANTSIVPDASDGATIGSASLEWSDLYLADGAVVYFGDDQDVSLTHVADTGLLLSSTDQLQFGDSGTYIYQSADGVLDLVSDTEIELTATTIDINGAVAMDGAMTGGTNITISGELDAATLDISGNADIDGTLEADAITVDGTALNEYIADTVGAMVSSNTESGITVAYEDGDNTLDFTVGTLNQDTTGTADNITVSANNSTDETVYPIFVDGATGSQGAESDTGLTYNPSSGLLTTTLLAGTLNTAAQGNVTSLGTLTALTVDNVVIDGAVIGHTGDTDLITLSSGVVTVAGEVDATSLDISGNADIDGTLEADAITVDGTALNEYIADTIGAMVGSNTETGITVTYEDGDNTLDFVIGTLNQDTTGNAATFTATANNSTDETVYPVFVDGATGSQGAETDTGFTYNPSSGLLTISGELDAGSLDISGNADIDGTLEADAITVDGTALNEYIADTVGAMVGSNTETGITVTYEDGDNTLDFVIGTLNQDTTGTASKVVVTDSTANTNFPVVFHDESNALLDDTGALRYNPSTGTLLVPNLSVAGTTTTVDTVTMEAQNAIIFEGATADSNETTLSIVDPTSDHTQYLINQGGYIPVLAAATTTAITATPAELNILDGVTSTAAELNILDGATVVVGELNYLDLGSTAVGTAIASKAVVLDSNKDYTGLRNLTITGELDAATLDISGDVDIDGTLETDNLTVGGAQGSDGQVLTSTGSGVAWEDAASGGTTNLSGLDEGLASGSGDFAGGILISNDGGTGTLSSALYNTGLGWEVFDDLTTGDSNVGVGYKALEKLTTGSNNTAIGSGALDAITTQGTNVAIGTSTLGGASNTASDNTGVGYAVLLANTTGDNNVGVGVNALQANTTGADNVGVGRNSLIANTTGNYNTAVGSQALDANTTANSNTAVGSIALTANTTGAANTAVGRNALGANTTASNNVAVGEGALESNTTGDELTAIGSKALTANTTATRNTAVGHDAQAATTTGGYNTSIGHRTLFVNTTGTENTAAGYLAMDANTTGNYNVAMGVNALGANTTANYNVAIGAGAMIANTTVGENVAIGAFSLDANTTGGNNCAVGYNSLSANTTGGQNTAIGHTAYDAVTTASNGTAVGYGALGANTTGAQNTAVGANAGDAITTGSNNSALGYEALGKLTTGTDNIGIGRAAALDITTGDGNIAVGVEALENGTTGSNNTAVGKQAGRNVSTATNNLLLGKDAGVTGSPGGNITTGSNLIVLGDENIGTFYCTQSSINTSDRRDKNSITNFTGGLSWINAMNPITYKWDRRSWYIDSDATPSDLLAVTPDGSKVNPSLEIGLIAQDVLDIEKANGYGADNDNSLLVNLTEDETRYGLNYTKIVPILISAIKELSAKVEALES